MTPSTSSPRRSGRDRQHLIRVAAGSADETITALRVAAAWGEIDARATAAAIRSLDRVLAIEDLELVSFEPPRSFTLVSQSCGCHFVIDHRFSEAAGATRVDLEVRTRPASLIARILSPLSRLMIGTMKKAIRADLDDLKSIAEAPANPAAAS